MAKLKEGSVIAKATGDETIATTDDIRNIKPRVTKRDVGLGNVTNDRQATKEELESHKGEVATSTKLGHVKAGNNITIDKDGTIHARGGSTGGSGAVNSVNGKIGHVELNSGDIGLGNVKNIEQLGVHETARDSQRLEGKTFNDIRTSITKENVGLGSVTNDRQATKAEFDAHTRNTTNPHRVSKEQVGLGLVLNKEQLGVNETAKNSERLGGLTLAEIQLGGEIPDVNKESIGLGNVDNVKQASKAEFDTHKGQIASSSTLGHIKVGDHLQIDSEGKLNVSSSAVSGVSSVNGKTGNVNITKDDIPGIGGSETVEVGPGAYSRGQKPVSVGHDTKATGDGSISIGSSAATSGNNSIVIGQNINLDKDSAIAIGDKATPNGISAIAIGIDSKSSGGIYNREASIAIGSNASATEKYSVGIGSNSKSNEMSASIGNDTEANKESVALGYNAKASSNKSVALGKGAKANSNYSVAIGAEAAAANANEGVLGGSGNQATNRWIIPGSLVVEGTKNFEMPHPNPDKKDTHRLRHSAVESPTAGDNLYRYEVESKKKNDVATIDLPDYFIHLNKDVQIWVNGQNHFGSGYGEYDIDKEQVKIHCQEKGIYNVLIIGTRNDDHPNIKNWDIKGVEKSNEEDWLGKKYTTK